MPLDEYRRKRKAGATPEPFGGKAPARPHLFVVQKHAATSLHYDLRLEWKGVLLSWAVPKGPSSDPATKRLAMHVEDHPVEYADFEGSIPEGNYGAGQVIVWDIGSYVPLEDIGEGLGRGKLLFELRGQKLGGTWTLFKTGRKDGDDRQWLLVKKPDAWAGDAWNEDSVLSGLSLDELRDGSKRASNLAAEAEKLGAKKRAVEPEVMLAETAEKPPEGRDWIFELKYDGFRLLASKEGLLYRSGRDATKLYPEIVRAVRALPYGSLLLDGEICVLDPKGVPEFQRLQQRAKLARAIDIERASVESPATCFLFDLLEAEGYDLRPLPLVERKRLLKMVLPPRGFLRYSDHVEGQGEAFYRAVTEKGLEGILAKRATSPYKPGRSPLWLKVKADRTGDFVIVGWTAPQGSRAGLGALHLGAFAGGELTYVGRVGTGLTDRELTALRAQLEKLAVEAPPCTGPVPKTRGNHWVRPELVCEVRFKERTSDGLLRQPAFLRMRGDKPPKECEAPAPRGDGEGSGEPAFAAHGAASAGKPAATRTRGAARTRAAGAGPPPLPRAPSPPEPEPALTNPDKVFWPKERYTKGDLVAYYRAVAPWLLPYLKDRPVVLTRFPDGIEGKSFFQKDAPPWTPAWMRTEKIWSEETEREIEYFLCDDERSIAFLANLGTIPLHVWSSRVVDLGKPDWCILDLDPKGAPFADVVKVALAARKLCGEIGLPCYVKTSGSTGIHVLLPLGGQCTYEQSRTLGEVLARAVERRVPSIATTERVISKREGRVYLDYLQNGHGKLLVGPYSVRPLPGAPVSTPLSWSEVTAKLDPSRFTIRTVPARLKRKKKDPLLGVLSDKPDLPAALAKLAKRA
ncbi:MAG TPA: DNA ligase D [Planctomycetota bacterium]|nr:DNA ligase D [Planctomycetota bacterium]